MQTVKPDTRRGWGTFPLTLAAFCSSSLVQEVRSSGGSIECNVSNPCYSNQCCSQFNYCGTSPLHCGSGCQSGNCIQNSPPVGSQECGNSRPESNTTYGRYCDFNLCCSGYGYCGLGNEYCGAGCQSGPCWLQPSTRSGLSRTVDIGIAAAVIVGLLFAVLSALLLVYYRKKYSKSKAPDVDEGLHEAHSKEVEDPMHSISGTVTVLSAKVYSQTTLPKLNSLGVRLSFQSLDRATNGFSKELGRGAFGQVYAGTLSDGRQIAVKKLVNSEGGLKDFEAEVRTLGSINHANLVALLGFSFERNQPFLIFEFVANGSLDKWIFPDEVQEEMDSKFVLPWKTRVDIAKGTAKGLTYLHEDLQIGQAIIHLDIKPENILLDASFMPKVADFGMAKLLGAKRTQTVVSGGTIGYMAPEVYTGSATTKMDVYSFGILLLELLSGRRHLNHSLSPDDCYLPSWAIRKVARGEELVVIDPNLDEAEVDHEVARRLILVGLLCLQRDPDLRPDMSTVLRMIEGNSLLSLQLPESLQSELEMTERLVRRGPNNRRHDRVPLSRGSSFIDFSSVSGDLHRAERKHGQGFAQQPLLLHSHSWNGVKARRWIDSESESFMYPLNTAEFEGENLPKSI